MGGPAAELVGKAFRESDEIFRQLADNITDAFWIRSPDMRTVHYVSPAFERIWGRPVALLYDHPERWPDDIHPDDREGVLAAFQGLVGEAPSLEMEYRIVRPDGDIRWVHVRGFQIRDGDNAVLRHAGIVTAITDRMERFGVSRDHGLRRRGRAGSCMPRIEARYRSIDHLDGYVEALLKDGAPVDVDGPLEDVANAGRISGMAVRGVWVPKAEIEAKLKALWKKSSR